MAHMNDGFQRVNPQEGGTDNEDDDLEGIDVIDVDSASDDDSVRTVLFIPPEILQFREEKELETDEAAQVLELLTDQVNEVFGNYTEIVEDLTSMLCSHFEGSLRIAQRRCDWKEKEYRAEIHSSKYMPWFQTNARTAKSRLGAEEIMQAKWMELFMEKYLQYQTELRKTASLSQSLGGQSICTIDHHPLLSNSIL